MDYVTRQFINLVKKFRRELPKLHQDIKQQTEAIREAKDAYKQAHNTPPILRADLQIPHSIEVQTSPKDKKTGREWYKLVIETLTLLGVLAYATITVRMWREMIFTRHQAQAAVEAAGRAANAAETANSNAKQQFRIEERPYVALAPAGDTARVSIVQAGEHKGHLEAEIHISNYGKSPAIELARDARIAVGSAACKRLKIHAPDDRLQRIIPPGDKPSIFAYSDEAVNPQILSQVSSGTLLIIVYGHIDYTDTLSEPRPQYSSEFCGAILAGRNQQREAEDDCKNHIRMK